MRFSVTFPDDLVTQIDDKADEEGRTRSEWIRYACTTMITTSITELEDIIETYREKSFDLADKVHELTAECAQLKEVINGDQRGDQHGDNVTQEITTLQAELQHKDHLIAMQKDEIQWLRGEVAKLNDKIPMLPAPRDHPWWMIWKR
jgi:predicted RNase H-like nuclease (RuvC/YqgF family)